MAGVTFGKLCHNRRYQLFDRQILRERIVGYPLQNVRIKNVAHGRLSLKKSGANASPPGRSDQERRIVRRRVAIVGAGVAGLGAAWALNKHPDRFDIRVFEANPQVGGNAVTVDMPQDDGTSIPFDISVTACIPTVYHNYLQLLKLHSIDLVNTQFNYSVKCREDIYAHAYDSEFRRRLQPEIDRFQKLLAFLQRFNV